MQSTIDPFLDQVARFLDFTIRQQNSLTTLAEIDGIFASLYTLRELGFAETGSINEFDKEHWHPSHQAYWAMQLDEFKMSRRAERRGMAPGMLCMVTEPVGWYADHETLLATYATNAANVPLDRAWRTVGTLVAALGKRHLNLAATEEDGGLIFRITKRGQREMFNHTDRDAFHFSLTGSSRKENPVAVLPGKAEWLTN